MVDFDIVLKHEPVKPLSKESEKWLEDVKVKMKPIMDDFFKSPEYKKFIEEKGTEMMLYGQSIYSSKEMEEVVDSYNKRKKEEQNAN